MALYDVVLPVRTTAPTLVAAFDSWVDAGSASTAAAARLADDAEVVVRFDPDSLYDYRARRPTLEIIDGRPAHLTWPELTLRRRSLDDRDLLVLTGPEPDYRWRELATAAVELARRFDVAEWVSMGAIPAAVPHTRDVPIMGTASRPGLLRGNVQPGPDGTLTVPAAAISVLDHAVSRAGIPAVGYFAQVPHYITGAYPAAATALLRVIGEHLRYPLAAEDLEEEARQLRVRLDAATAVDETTREYITRLESMVDESRQPSGDDLIADIERFLRDQGREGRQRG